MRNKIMRNKKHSLSSMELPKVFSLEKKIVPSDGYLYETMWDDEIDKMEAEAKPIRLKEKTIRGTKCHSNASEKDVREANIQKIDSCYLSEKNDTLKVEFTLKFLGNIDKPSACNSKDFHEKYREKIKDCNFEKLSERYAINIANARFLWKNRMGVCQLKTVVEILKPESYKGKWIFDSTKIQLNDFEKFSDDSEIRNNITMLSEKIEEAFSSDNNIKSSLLMKISAYAQIGFKQEIYPSQELVHRKDENEKSKILYHINEIAGLHSQKIGNAIRTIDTWYPDYKFLPIPVEPYGSVTNLDKAYRHDNDKDFYTLFKKFMNDEELEETEKLYVIAILIRGGVFNGKKEKSDSRKQKSQDQASKEEE